ncbi:MAG: S-adenosylmethionine:tRNA ribosyltransferase-isomerase [Flavobacteriales bacterium]|nr:S-adenosylmethionine:tRNA ribosyltransferase-isomerase [Flavobacteriales bacterium]
MHPRELAIADYTYALPEDRIAQQPLPERDASRLLVYREGSISDRFFRELTSEIPSGALLVLNDTRVVNARLVFHRDTGARIEVLCLSPADDGPVEEAFAQKGCCEWRCFIGNAKRWKEGERLLLRSGAIEFEAARIAPDTIRFRWSPAEHDFAYVLEALGHVPLPPYMKRSDSPADRERYNTVFAEHEGSVAAPTASLHLTPAILEALRSNGTRTASVTLHVGAGTFLPVKSGRMEGHGMHGEQVRIPLAALESFADRMGKGPIIAVGTTALRTLESVYWHGVKLLQGPAVEEMAVEQWEPYDTVDPLPTAAHALEAVLADLTRRGEDRLVGHTSLLIAPGYRFRFTDALVTNFHQPQSTLLLLVAAFIGQDWRAVYDHALLKGYRFLSYGDGSLLWRSQ